MGKKRFCASILKEDEELQRRLEILIKMPHDLFKKEDVSDLRDQELPPYDPMVVSTYTSVRPQFLRYKPRRHDLYCLGGQPELPPYDPLVPSTYTSARPKFLRYRPNREDDDKENYPMERMGKKSFFTPKELQRTRFEKMRKVSYQEKFQRMEPSGISPYFQIVVLILLAVLSVSIVCRYAGHSTKLSADSNLQALHQYADGSDFSISESSEEMDLPINGTTDELINKLQALSYDFGLPISECLEEMDLLISEIADEMGLLINNDPEESGLQINENKEHISMSIDGYEFESTYKFGAHMPISEISKELVLPTNKYATALAVLINKDSDDFGLQSNESTEHINVSIGRAYAHGFDFSISESSEEMVLPINRTTDELINKLQALSDNFGLPTSECLEEMDMLISEIADEMGLLINKDPEESDLQINENMQHINLSIDGYETHGLALFGTPEFESTYKFGAHMPISKISKELDLPTNKHGNELALLTNKDSVIFGLQINESIEHINMSIDGYEPHGLSVLARMYNFRVSGSILTGLSETVALKSPNHMEYAISEVKMERPNLMEDGMSEVKKAKEWLLDVIAIEEESEHLGVLDVLATAKDSKRLGAILSITSIKSCGSPFLYGIMGGFLCAVALVLNWYKRRAIYCSSKTCLESVEGIQARMNNTMPQYPLMQFSKMQKKVSSVPSMLSLNEYCPAKAVSSSGKKKDSMWNEMEGNAIHISNVKARKHNSASTTNQESIITGGIYMKNSSSIGLTSVAKDNDKKQQKLIPVRKSDRLQKAAKSNYSFYKQDIDKKQQKGIPLRRSERIRNSTKI